MRTAFRRTPEAEIIWVTVNAAIYFHLQDGFPIRVEASPLHRHLDKAIVRVCSEISSANLVRGATLSDGVWVIEPEEVVGIFLK